MKFAEKLCELSTMAKKRGHEIIAYEGLYYLKTDINFKSGFTYDEMKNMLRIRAEHEEFEGDIKDMLEKVEILSVAKNIKDVRFSELQKKDIERAILSLKNILGR